jgi:hypothetical protein
LARRRRIALAASSGELAWDVHTANEYKQRDKKRVAEYLNNAI